MSNNPKETASNIPRRPTGVGTGGLLTRSASASFPTSSQQSTPRNDGRDRGQKRSTPDEYAVGAAIGNPSATALGDAAVSAEEEETRTADDNAAEDDSLTTDEVQRLLLLSGQRTNQEVRRLLTDSERRHQRLVEESEHRQREQMELFQAQNAQLQARTDQLLEALRVAQTLNARTSTEPLVEETPFGRRRPRFSTASNLVFGDEDTPLGTSLPHRPLPPHLVPQTPQTTATSRWDDRSPHPRAAKSKEM
ncbi:unnamed protein product, partial [Tilletia controversa]